jgi:ATP-dependent Clp protease protease subunit
MMKKIKSKSEDNTLAELFRDKTVDVKPLGNLYTIYLVGEITDPDDYINCYEAIRNAGEDDVVKIHINSHGGDLFTTIQFIRAIAESPAKIIASAEGCCMSAATMIFLCADMYEISEHCLFMFHNYSGGVVGKGGEMYDQLINERKWSEKIVQKVYSGFLTDGEMKSILENKDIWMDGEEVMKRLQSKLDGLIEEQEKSSKPARKTPVRRKKSA